MRNNLSFRFSKQHFVVLLIGILSFSLQAQNSERKFLGHNIEGNVVTVTTNDGVYRFMPYSEEIMETSFIPKGETYNPKSYAVVLEPKKVNVDITEDLNSLKIDTDGLDVVITKAPFQVTYYFEGEKVLSEKMGYSKTEEYEKLDFNLNESEMLFGGGARALGMNRRGNRLQLYNRAHYGYTTKSELLNYTLPIAISSKKYLLHFDNAPIGYLDLDSEHNNTLAYETISGRKTYQIVVGETWEKIISNYTLLTGRQPMPPRWAFGNFSSRFGYHSQQEVENTIAQFKKDSIPVDAVILDLYWFGHDIKGTMGNLEFVKDSFPEPKKMIANLAEKGVSTILVTEPFILTTSKKWDDAVAQNVLGTDSIGQPFKFDFYFGNTGLIDIFKPKARDWFWEIYKDLKSYGVKGWWGDLGEPEVHPSKLQHSIGSADEVHNIYGHYWAKLIYDGYREEFPKERSFILMRAGAAGSQRFGMIPWSGDVSRSWGGLKPQPEIALQMGLQGLAYMHSDLGGFAGDLEDNELYTRWLQYGVFQPIFRPHAQEEVASEPVFKNAETKALAKKSIELRYKLLPYNYTLAYLNSNSGLPLMRPLFFEEPENYKLYSISNTYLWGNNFLISPIVRPNISEKEIYFPATSNWYDFYNGKKYEKGSRATVALEKDYIPTFVRGGAFIPMAKPMQNTSEYKVSNLDIQYYFDADVKSSEGLIYNDDGKTPNSFKNGAFELLKLKSETSKNSLSFNFEKEVGNNFKSEFKNLDVIVHNISAKPKAVNLNGKSQKFSWNEDSKELIFRIELEKELTTVNIKFN